MTEDCEWIYCPNCGHEWVQRSRRRERRQEPVLQKKQKRLGYGLLVKGRLQSFCFTKADARADLKAWNDSPFCTATAIIVELVEST